MFYFPNTRKPNWREIDSIDYDQYWHQRGFTLNSHLKERESIILNLVEAGSRVLDIGCGSSLLPIKLQEKGCLVTVADISAIVLDNFEKFGIATLKLDLENIASQSLGGDYDYIILSEVLEHTTNPEEIISVLKGKTKNLIITIPNSAFYRYRLHLLINGRFFTQWVYHPSEHLRFWSHSDFVDWLQAMDLKLVKFFASNGFSLFGCLPQLKDFWPNLFGHQIVYLCATDLQYKQNVTT